MADLGDPEQRGQRLKLAEEFDALAASLEQRS
jgi:hypothetical protein